MKHTDRTGPRMRRAARIAAFRLRWIAEVGVDLALVRCRDFRFSASSLRRKELARRDAERAKLESGWLIPEERELVEALARVIVPSDDDTPGAEEVEVLGTPIAAVIEGWLAGSVKERGLYAHGLIAFEQWCRQVHGEGAFARLPNGKKVEILNSLEALAGGISRRSGLAGKVWRKVQLFARAWKGSDLLLDFFSRARQDILKAFYTSEVSWIWLDYDGPPMPEGYTDPLHPRQERKVRQLREIAEEVAARKRDSNLLERARRKECDVVVVGSGAGGAVVAKELGEAGLSVVVLEAGARFDPYMDYHTDRVDFEATATHPFDQVDPRRDFYTTGGKRGFDYSRAKGVGGSTLKYVAMSPRLHENDFRMRSEDGVGVDWPIEYADLEPCYTRVEYELGVSGADGPAANPFRPWRSRPYPNPPHPFNRASLAIESGAKKLGHHMFREPVAIPSRDWNGRPACVGAGTCHMGCQIMAKSSMDVTYVPKAEATGNVEFRTRCTASQIVLGPDGKAKSVVYFDSQGVQHEVRSRAVVVAGNAVETARLLLLSASNQFPDGLANSSGLVGKNFMEHLAVFATGVFEQRLDSWRGIPSGGMIQDFYGTKPGHDFVRGWSILVTANSPWPYAVARRIAGWGVAHKKSVCERFGRTVSVASIGEQLPDVRNHVSLNPIERDNFGLPVPHLVNEPRENDLKMIRAIAASLDALLDASGVKEIVTNAHAPGLSSHYLGTCRMGNDPSSSVVDAWGRSHDVSNLFIADGSVLPTGGSVNPALTISALATRTSDKIVEAFRLREL